MEAPESYKQAGQFMMIAGILGIVFGAINTICLCVSIYGLICIWMPLISLGLGIFEAINGNKAQKGEHIPSLKTISIIAIVVYALTFNVIGLVMEIMATVNLGKEDAAEFLEKGGTA